MFALLAIFPSLAATVAIYGIVASPDAIAAQVQAFSGLLPPAGMEILQLQLDKLIAQRSDTLSVGAALGVILALWSARKGMVAMITAMNVAYNERDRRSFFMQLVVSTTFTVCGVLGFVCMILLGVAVPVALAFLPLGAAAQWVLLGARWILLWLIAIVALSTLYRFAPHRARALGLGQCGLGHRVDLVAAERHRVRDLRA